jgi:hypothetical protein
VIPVPNPRPAIIFRGGPIRGRHRSRSTKTMDTSRWNRSSRTSH